MLLSVLAVLLVGAASAEHNHAWETGKEYHYTVDSRTLTGLPEISNQYTGVLIRGSVKVQPKDEFTLNGKLSKIEYAQIHTQLPDGWDSKIPDDVQEFKPLATSGKPFEVRLKHGTVREIAVDKNTPTWEVNLLKSIISQFQVDTRGENMVESRDNQLPENEDSNAMFKTMEDSVGGKCEVQYDINALAEPLAEAQHPDLPGAQWRTEGEVYEIVKTKDYAKCKQRRAVHYGVPGQMEFEPGSSHSGDFLFKSSISKVAASGNLQAFTIHSSETTEEIILRPNLHDSKSGIVASRVNLSLSNVEPVTNRWPSPSNPESVGNLVYTYDRPFAPEGEDRTPGQPTVSERSKEENDADSQSSEGKPHRHHYDDSSSDRSSGNSDESDNGSRRPQDSRNEGKYYQQPRPTLNEPPQYPILSVFIGNNGKSLSSSGETDLATRAKTLASEIGRDIQNPDSIPHEQTLEKFTILSDILRTMSIKELRDIQSDLYQPSKNVDPNDEGQNVKSNTWAAFRAAIANVGSGPALLLITELLKTKKIEGQEAVEVISVLSKTAKEPTPEYVNALFKMATMPEVVNDEQLAAASIMAFTELLRYAQVNRQSSHNRFPVHAFGSFLPDNEDALLQDYLPYLIENFEKGMKNNDHHAQLYMRAIGNTGHPKIMSIFEPYLEGKKPSTAYQRVMMVLSMDKLMNQRPKTVRGLCYRIYQNTGESYKVRAVAASLVIASSPSLPMLQRMAQFTNFDVSKHVNSIVKSLIESAAQLTTDESKKLMENARAVRHLLTPENYGIEYSKANTVDKLLKDLNIAYTTSQAWLGSDDSFIPSGIYGSIDEDCGGFKTPRAEKALIVSSAQQLLNAVKKLLKNMGKGSSDNSDIASNNQATADEIAQKLNIKAKKTEKLQGLYLSRDHYSNTLLSWDEDTLKDIHRELFTKAAKELKSGRNFNMISLQNSEIMIGFPTETGFPFTYSVQMPRLRKLSGKIQGTTDPDYSEGSSGKPKAFELSGDIQVVYSQKLQSRFGFAAPFERQKYLSGADKNIQVHLPISAQINYDSSKRQASVKVQPINKNDESILFHFGNVPFTAHQDIADLKPTTLESRSSRMIMKNDARESTTLMGEKTRGMVVKVKEIKPKRSPSIFGQWKNLENLEERALFLMADRKLEYYVVDAAVAPNPSSEQSVVVTVAWDTKTKKGETGAPTSSAQSNSKVEAREPASKGPLSPSRRKEMMEEALKDFPAGQGMAVDVNVEMPGQEPWRCIMTASLARNEASGRWKSLMYLQQESGTSQRGPFEACAAAGGSFPEPSPFNSNKMRKPDLQRSIHADVKFGQSCSAGSRIEIHGRQWQSEEYEKSIKGNSKKLADLGIPETLLDKTRVTIEATSEEHTEKCEHFLNHAMHFVTGVQEEKFIEASPGENDNKNMIEIEAKVEPGDNKVSVSLKAPRYEAVANEMELRNFVMPALSADTERTEKSRQEGTSPQNTCIIGKSHVKTFDGAYFPLKMNKCVYVATTAVPEQEFGDSRAEIRADKKASVMIRQDNSDESARMLTISLGKKKIHMSKSNSQVEIQVNNEKINPSSGYSDGEDELEIMMLPNGVVSLDCKKYGLKVQYDGDRARLEMTDKYRDSVRGLCGNYDSEPGNDLMTPQNRICPKPDEFSMLYILPTPECRQTGDKWREVEKSYPVNSPKLSNVVSDREAGRTRHEKEGWAHPHGSKGPGPRRNKPNTIVVKTRILPGNEQTCFSLRPLPTCSPGARPIRTRTALFPVYCIPTGESSKRLSDRINKGANPDFSQKPPSMKVKLEIAEKCSPAA